MKNKIYRDFCKKTGLNPSEGEYIEETEMMRHPIYTGFVRTDDIWLATYKKGFDMIKEKIQLCLSNHDYSGYVWLHSRPFRLQAFMEVLIDSRAKKGDKYTGKLCASIWIDSENPLPNISVWKNLFHTFGKNLMTKKERKFFKKLPNEFTVYHGDEGEQDANISFTLNKKVAEFFAHRFTSDIRKVTTRVIKKSEALCYLNGRSEEEIIILT